MVIYGKKNYECKGLVLVGSVTVWGIEHWKNKANIKLINIFSSSL